MAKVYASLSEMIGNTPLLHLSAFTKALGIEAELYAKLEGFNPGGSVKDRVALSMIDDAEKRGLLKKGSVIVEPTSGNTGIGLCAVAAVKGYRVIIVMPETMSRERQLLMRAYGAELVLTDGARGMQGAIDEAERLVQTLPNAFMPAQFDNPANPEAHSATASEIYEALGGNVQAFVAGAGTGGTLTGVGRWLKQKSPAVRIVGVEPADSPVLSGGKAGVHGLQGIGAGFVPKVLDVSVMDSVMCATTQNAYAMARLFARTEGLLVGISSGAALWAATELGRKEEYRKKNIVVLLPDGGERYLSTDLFAE